MRFAKYKNKESGLSKIYSKSTIKQMTLQELLKEELALAYQYHTLGIPEDEELYSSENVEQKIDDFGKSYWNVKNSVTDNAVPIVKDLISKNNTKPNIVFTAKEPDASLEYDINSKNQYKVINYLNDSQKNPITNIPNQNNYFEENNSDISNESVPLLKGYVDNSPKTFLEKYDGLKPAEIIQKIGSKLPFGSTELKYYGLSAHMADGEDYDNTMKRENDFYKLKDIQTENQKTLYDKIVKANNLDPNDPNTYEKIKNTNIVVPKENSQLSQYVKDSETMQEWIANNYKEIQDKTIENNNKHIEFLNKNLMKNDSRALYLTLHNADIDDVKINEDGSLNITLNDYYDFDKIKNDSNGFINNNAYGQQEKGQIENYALSVPIHYTKEELEEILRKLKKY